MLYVDIRIEEGCGKIEIFSIFRLQYENRRLDKPIYLLLLASYFPINYLISDQCFFKHPSSMKA